MISLPEVFFKRKSKVAGDWWFFPRGSVERKHFMRFQSETPLSWCERRLRLVKHAPVTEKIVLCLQKTLSRRDVTDADGESSITLKIKAVVM